MDETQSLKPRYRTVWQGLLAGLASMTLTWTVHKMLAASQRLPGDTAFTDHSDSTLWLLMQALDFAGSVAAGVAAAHWSKRLSWRAVWGVLAMVVVNLLMWTAPPVTHDGFRIALALLASPLGVLLGAFLYRRRERMQPEALVRPVPPDHQHVPHTPYGEAAVVVALCFSYFIVVSTLAVFSPGAGAQFSSDNSLLSIILLELILAACALGVLSARAYPLRTLLPRASWTGVVVGAVLYLLVVIADTALGWFAPDRLWQPVQQMLEGHRSLVVLLSLSVVNGVYEEVFLLAFLQRGLRRLGGSNALGIALLVRMLYHTYQGPLGLLAVAIFGLIAGYYYLRSGRLFPVIVAHIVADVSALGS
jgi:membrane protease YdiL (CAAX protease family)